MPSGKQCQRYRQVDMPVRSAPPWDSRYSLLKGREISIHLCIRNAQEEQTLSELLEPSERQGVASSQDLRRGQGGLQSGQSHNCATSI